MLHVTVSLSALRENLAVLRAYTSAKICAVVKADAYGVGLGAIRALDDADEFAVANVAEAIDLRAYTDKPIHILSLPDRSDTRAYPENVYPAAADADTLSYVAAHGASAADIKVDTGMHRYGASPQDLGELLREASKRHVAVRSVFSHVYDRSAAVKQYVRFRRATDPYAGDIPERHLLSSLFMHLPAYMHLDMVRAGLVLYGYGHDLVRPVVTATCPVLQVREVRADENIGYGICPSGAWRKIAVLGAGYADGIRRTAGGEPRYVAFGTTLCPLVGQVCMDAMTADISGLDVSVGDHAVVWGDAYGIPAVATSCGTIPYEILTEIGKRAIRAYV